MQRSQVCVSEETAISEKAGAKGLVCDEATLQKSQLRDVSLVWRKKYCGLRQMG